MTEQTMTTSVSSQLNEAVTRLFRELAHGTAPDSCWVLNPKDQGLLASLDRISATAASSPSPGGGASIAAHVDHLRYGFELMNRWAQGEDPFSTADYSTSWKRGSVDEPGWNGLRAALRNEIDRWGRVIEQPRQLNAFELTGMLASVVHLAYHLGAMRQIDPTLKGPPASD